MKNSRTHYITNPVIHCIPSNCSNAKNNKKKFSVKAPKRSNCTCCKKQGISWQERCHHKPCLTKNNKKENGISPCPIISNYLSKMLVKMHYKIKKIFYNFHNLHIISPSLLL